jgi:hypothetical protein
MLHCPAILGALAFCIIESSTGGALFRQRLNLLILGTELRVTAQNLVELGWRLARKAEFSELRVLEDFTGL